MVSVLDSRRAAAVVAHGLHERRVVLADQLEAGLNFGDLLGRAGGWFAHGFKGVPQSAAQVVGRAPRSRAAANPENALSTVGPHVSSSEAAFGRKAGNGTPKV